MQRQCQSFNLPSALWLPDSIPSWTLQAPLMAVVGKLFFYRPLAAAGEEEELALWGDAAVCLGINPVADRDCEALAAMMRDVADHGEEFLLGQLSAMSTPGPEPETGISRLIGRLRSGASGDGDGEAARHRLNRARFLLALAELRRQQEEEVARGLALAEERQRELLGELAGAGAPVALPATTPGSAGFGPAENTEALLRAWFNLWVRDVRTQTGLLACSGAAGEAILADGEGGEPFLVLGLPCPGAGVDPATWINDTRNRFAGLIPAVAGLFDKPETFGDGERADLAREWAAVGGADFGCRLAIYRVLRGAILAAVAPELAEDMEPAKKSKHDLVAVLAKE